MLNFFIKSKSLKKLKELILLKKTKVKLLSLLNFNKRKVELNYFSICFILILFIL